MKYLKNFGRPAAMALVATWAIAASASATTIDPLSTSFTLGSTNSSLAVSGPDTGGTVACNVSTATGTTPPSGGVTSVTVPVVLSYSGCTAFVLPATVTPNAACSSGTTQIKLVLMGTSATTATATVILPVGCNIDISIPAISCTLTITGGGQTIGNGTSGAGGMDWSNASPKSSAAINSAAVAGIDSSGGGFGCPTGGLHTGTLTGTYGVTSATNLTVTP